MIFSYYNLSQPLGSCRVTIPSPQVQRDQRGNIVSVRRVWNIEGEILADTQAAITTALNQLESYYNRDGGDAILYLPDGTTSYHVLRSRDTLSGVRSGFIFYPDGDGAEYVNGRRWALELSADYGRNAFDGNQNNSLLSFIESLTITGNGGPEFVVRTTRNTRPIKQVVSQSTPYAANQSGQATGYYGYPQVPPPIWPDALINPSSAITKVSPQQSGSGSGADLTVYQVSWNYQFSSPTPLRGLPSQRKS